MYEKSHFGLPCATVNLPNEEYVDQLICAEQQNYNQEFVWT